MPVIYQRNTERGWLVLWRITETEDELLACATPGEKIRASEISSVARRCQWLAWRAALRSRIPGAVVEYDDAGGPVLVGGGFIGVTHTEGLAAVIWDSERPCALDAEKTDRNFDRVARRYLTPGEEALAGGDPHFRAVAWCAKETLYKYAREKGADLLRDLRIIKYKPATGRVQGESGADSLSEIIPGDVLGRDGANGFPVFSEDSLVGRLPDGRDILLRFFTCGEYVIVYTPGTFFV